MLTFVKHYLNMEIKLSELRHIEKLSEKQLLTIIPVCRTTIYNWKVRGMPYHKYETGVYFILDDVLNWMKTQPKLIEMYIHIKRKIEDTYAY